MPPSIIPAHGALCVLLFAALAADTAGAAARSRPPPKAQTATPAVAPAAGAAFDYDALLTEAKRRAAQGYVAPRNPLPAPLDKLNPQQYRSIQFNPDYGIWRNDKLPFRLELVRAERDDRGNAAVPVIVSTVENGRAVNIPSPAALFETAASVPALGKLSIPLSGFRLRNQINEKNVWDEFLVFPGASYFRAVAKHLLYGLSARGLAINTAEPVGEEFPSFTHFWIERPAARAKNVVIYALLESESTTGAYRFTVTPGDETVMDVDATLFPRAEMRVVGIAPLTSMFLFDETNRGRLDDYRPEVHDSDGLQITSNADEHIFRQLANPTKLQVSTFTTLPPKGFGLVQRSREQGDFQDLENHYERRPSAWVEPAGDWGRGGVELIEIPSGRETNDNIVAFWRPAERLMPGHPAHYAYRVTWSAEPPLPKGLGKIVATRSGASLDGRRRVFILDVVGAGEKTEGLRLDLAASTGRVSNASLVSNGDMHGLRVSFELEPGDADLCELRLRVLRGDRPISETWLYRWTAS